ncbi:unnamed protein product [Acanthosepion pharaonis]|uniref:Uncharacterized protein n=1 Tax=Acanthosepion pharaonis TaxID=158019 RepID=A0A812DCU1_ACAPH|nr:unnamed protein product [Sepia pharaonis]
MVDHPAAIREEIDVLDRDPGGYWHGDPYRLALRLDHALAPGGLGSAARQRSNWLRVAGSTAPSPHLQLGRQRLGLSERRSCRYRPDSRLHRDGQRRARRHPRQHRQVDEQREGPLIDIVHHPAIFSRPGTGWRSSPRRHAGGKVNAPRSAGRHRRHSSNSRAPLSGVATIASVTVLPARGTALSATRRIGRWIAPGSAEGRGIGWPGRQRRSHEYRRHQDVKPTAHRPCPIPVWRSASAAVHALHQDAHDVAPRRASHRAPRLATLFAAPLAAQQASPGPAPRRPA